MVKSKCATFLLCDTIYVILLRIDVPSVVNHKEMIMKQIVNSHSKCKIMGLVLSALLSSPASFALESDMDFKLKKTDSTTNSPKVILVDKDNKQLILQKLEAGAATLFNDEGKICLLSSDEDDYICFVTTNDQPALMWNGINATEPGIQVSADGKLQYRNGAGSWKDFDNLSGSDSIPAGSLEPDKIAVDAGKIIVGNGSSQGAAVSMSGDFSINNTGVTSIAPGVIVNADVNSSAAIAGSKIDPDFGAQAVRTTGSISGAAITASGHVTVDNAKSLKLSELDGTHTMALKAPDSVTADVTLTLPDGDGTSGQVLKTDGNGALSWTSPGAATISAGDLSADKIAVDAGKIIVGNGSSQGAAVSMSGDFSINNTGVTSIAPGVIVNADVNSSAAIAGSKIDPDFGAQAVSTTGNISGAAITASGDVTVGKAKSVILNDSDGSNKVALKAPNDVTTNVTLTLPDGDGTSGQVLQTDGDGVLSWSDTGTASISAGDLSADKIAVTSGQIIVGNGSGEGAAVSMSGDIEITNTGVTSIKEGVIVDADVSSSAAISGSKIDPDFGAQAVSTTGSISGAAITASGDVTVGKAKSVILNDSDGSNKVALKAPDSVTADVTLTLPDGDGTSGQVLQTNGNGALSWSDKGVVFASGVLASFGYHTDGGCESTEKFIQYATVGSTAYGLCVEKTERPAEKWGDANAICLSKGKRLPDYTEWRKACDGKTSGNEGTRDSDFSNMTGNWEWASSRPSAVTYDTRRSAASVIAGEDSCASVIWNWLLENKTNEGVHVFRCVR
jgi:hypothetical protein